MRTSAIAILALLSTAACAAKDYSVRGYYLSIEPSSVYYRAKSENGFAVQVAKGFGERHEVTLTYSQTDLSKTFVNPDGSPYYAPERMQSLQAGYRFIAYSSDWLAGIKVYVGPEAGVLRASLDGYNYSHNASVLTYGGSAGVLIGLYRGLELDLGWRFQHYDDIKHPYYSYDIGSKAGNLKIIYAGLGYRW